MRMLRKFTAKDAECIEAALNAMFWGDVNSFTNEEKPAPIWSSAPDPKWQRYATWLNTADRKSYRRHLEIWSGITAQTLRLGNLPLMDRERGTALEAEAQKAITALLDAIAALQRESETPTHTVTPGSGAIH